MRQTLSILLAHIVLLSSLNFSLGLHYCSGNLVSVAFLKEAKACDHGRSAAKAVFCPVHGKMMQSGEKKDCCADKTDFVKGEDHEAANGVQPLLDIDFQKAAPPADFLFANVAVEYYSPAEFLQYKPPLLFRNLPVLFQSFLN